MYGLDYLGLPKFVDLAVREHPAGWAAGCFANTFGNALPAVRRLLETGRCPLFRVHLLWSDTHSFGAAEIPTVRRLAREYEILKRAFPQVQIEISPFCEHNLANPDPYLEIVANEAPSCAPVNTPWKGGFSRKFKNEIHGDKAAPKGAYNYSWDGASCVDGDVEKSKAAHTKAQVYFWWHPAFNGRLNTNDKTPRPERKAWPNSDLIDSIIYLRTPAGDVKYRRNLLWKSHADRHETPPEPRAYKPVLIMPPKAKRVELVADNGQVVATAGPALPFNDGRFRYYWNDYGFKIAEKAVRIHGKPTAKLVVDGKEMGIVNPAFRGGSFR
jgi:hypothetical protein